MQGCPVNKPSADGKPAKCFCFRHPDTMSLDDYTLCHIFDDEKRGKKPLWINLEEQDQTERTSFNHIIAIHNPQIIGTISNLCR
jgi:hypothetical protein